MNNLKLEQPIAMKIAEIRDEAKDIKTFRFNNKIEAKPGQYILLWIPRINLKPFGISHVDDTGFEVTVCCVGEFTKELFSKKVGDTIGVQGPYGTGFSLDKKKVILVGGGYGSTLLSYLATTLVAKKADVTFIIGAKSQEYVLYKNNIDKSIKCIHVTDDGSFGKSGFTTEALKEILEKESDIDMIYSCGPEVMMKKVVEISDKYNIDCEVSLERYMKCGIGICGQCCLDDSGITVCCDGTIFNKKIIKDKILEFGKSKRDATGVKKQ